MPVFLFLPRRRKGAKFGRKGELDWGWRYDRGMEFLRFRTRRFSWMLLVGLGVCYFWSSRAFVVPTQLVWAGEGRIEFELTDPDEGKAVAGGKVARKFDTFGHWLLDLEGEADPVSAAKYAKLDEIISDAKRRIVFDPAIKEAKAQRKQALAVLKAIDLVLTDQNVLYPAGDYDVALLRLGLSEQKLDKKMLAHMLKEELNERRRDHALAHADEPFYVLDCDTSSIVYVAVAEAVGFELHLVDLPDHMFVRWELSDGTHVNWDTNDAEEVSDKEYAKDYRLGKKIRRQKVYLSSMTKDEAKGYGYFLRSARWEEKEREEKAISDLQKAGELYSQSTQVKAELAWLYATADCATVEQRKSSVKLAQAALDLEPTCAEFWDALAAAHGANGDFESAVKEAGKAMKYAETDKDRGEFKAHRAAYEKGKMPEKQ